MAYRWDPWRGCHRISEGCAHCYIHKGDAKRGIDTNVIVKSPRFDAPVARKKDGTYKMLPDLVWVCFSSDFLLEDADEWRPECFRFMRERPDLHFLFLTKRIERFADIIPDDWGAGYDNVTVGCTVENQRNCDKKLTIFDTLPIKHKNIILQPLLERVNIESHLQGVELVVVGGESDREARLFDYEWAVDVREQCVRHKVSFDYRQCGSRYLKNGITYRLNAYQLMSTARAEGLSVFFYDESQEG